AVELGRAAALGARFPRGDVRRLRRTWRRSGATGWRSGARVLETATALATYPPGHPRARVDGPDAWRGVGPRRVRRAWAAATAAPRTLVVSGHFDGGPVLPLLEEAWSGGSTGAALPDSPPPAGGARLVLVDHPGATQVLVRASLPAPGLGDPGLAAVRLLTELLGGGFTSRLNARLREELGITYGAGATLALARSHGRMLLDTTVAPDDVVLALEEMNHALLMLALRPPDDAEIESARRALLLRADQSAQRLDGRTFPHGEALALGRAVDAVAQDRLAVQSVGLDVVRSSAAKLAATDDVTWLVVGDARLLESALTRAGWSPDALWQGQGVVEGRTAHVPP
ncbi:MAG: insulinase family protein, partial [Myxococcota bacterium]|nr:insulinase family protein [Myxococcota bacterium]